LRYRRIRPSLDRYNDGDDPGMWWELFLLMVRMYLQKDPSRQPTCQKLLLHRRVQPLVDADGRAKVRARTRMDAATREEVDCESKEKEDVDDTL
jgi:hypothetical protein